MKCEAFAGMVRQAWCRAVPEGGACRTIEGLFESLLALPAPVPQAQVSFVEGLSESFGGMP